MSANDGLVSVSLRPDQWELIWMMARFCKTRLKNQATSSNIHEMAGEYVVERIDEILGDAGALL
jgi:hypothetical protein